MSHAIYTLPTVGADLAVVMPTALRRQIHKQSSQRPLQLLGLQENVALDSVYDNSSRKHTTGMGSCTWFKILMALLIYVDGRFAV